MNSTLLTSPITPRERIVQASDKFILWVAFLWGLCIVMPVGMQYLCLLLLLLLMAIAGRYRETLQLFRQERFWTISVVAFLGITLLTLAVQEKYYPETPSNLFHGFRIVLTLWVGLSLRRDEALLALKSAACALCLASIFIALHHFGLTTGMPQWLLKLIPLGNRWISLSILLVMLLIACLRLLRAGSGRLRLWPLAIAGLALAMNLWVLNQRTAFLAMIVGLLCLILATWRTRKISILSGFFVTIALSMILIQTAGTLNTKFTAGLREIEVAQSGVVEIASMNIRYHMYKETTQMILERPWLGWGVGSWNEQWKARIDPILHGINMPHNDFLWMGAQSGWLGAFAWLALMLALCWMGWKQNNPMGDIAFAAAAVALVSSLFNSGTRDASIGLPMLFVVASCLASARLRDLAEMAKLKRG